MSGSPVIELLIIVLLVAPQRGLRRGRDRPRVDPPEPRRAARRRGPPRGPARPPPRRRSGPLPRGHPARHHVHRLPRRGVRGREPERRALDAASAGGSRLARPTRSALALVIVTSSSLFTIVFGELVPKTLALAHPERFALALAAPVDVLGRVLGPVVAVLTGTRTAIARLFGAHVSSDVQITRRGAAAHRRARRRAGHPRGGGGADDQRGHRARRAAASTR